MQGRSLPAGGPPVRGAREDVADRRMLLLEQETGRPSLSSLTCERRSVTISVVSLRNRCSRVSYTDIDLGQAVAEVCWILAAGRGECEISGCRMRSVSRRHLPL